MDYNLVFCLLFRCTYAPLQRTKWKLLMNSCLKIKCIPSLIHFLSHISILIHFIAICLFIFIKSRISSDKIIFVLFVAITINNNYFDSFRIIMSNIQLRPNSNWKKKLCGMILYCIVLDITEYIQYIPTSEQSRVSDFSVTILRSYFASWFTLHRVEKSFSFFFHCSKQLLYTGISHTNSNSTVVQASKQTYTVAYLKQFLHCTQILNPYFQFMKIYL